MAWRRLKTRREAAVLWRRSRCVFHFGFEATQGSPLRQPVGRRAIGDAVTGGSPIEALRKLLLGRQVAPPPSITGGAVPPEVTLRSGRVVPWLGGLFTTLGGSAAAVTLGRTIVVRPDVPLTPTLLAHELVHVRQWRRDPLFPLRYIVATMRYGYLNNPYEVEARAVAQSASAFQPPDDTT